MVTVVATDLNETNGIVVLESSLLDARAFDELRAADALKVALAEASKKGLPDPRINGTVNVYAIDHNGKEIEDAVNQQISAFRADVPVTRKLL